MPPPVQTRARALIPSTALVRARVAAGEQAGADQDAPARPDRALALIPNTALVRARVAAGEQAGAGQDAAARPDPRACPNP